MNCGERKETCLLPGGQRGSRTDRRTEQRTARYQDEVSVLCGPVLVGQFQDVSLLNELVSRVDDVLFAAQQLVHLQQLPHPLLRDGQTDRQMDTCLMTSVFPSVSSKKLNKHFLKTS